MTAGPAARLLEAFRLLSEAWLGADKARCEIHGGRFAPQELEHVQVNAPVLRAGCLAVASAEADGYGAVKFDFRLAAIVIGRRTAKDEPSGAQARRLAARLCFELAREQAGENGRFLWPQAAFSTEELDPATGRGRWGHIADPREIRAANLYSGQIDKKGVAIWAVTWMQEFHAIPSDFDLPLPEPAGIPATVKAGHVPEIGPGNEEDYETVVPQGVVS